MQSQRSAMEVTVRSARRVRPGRTIFIGSRARVALRARNLPVLGTRPARKPRSGPAWLALTLGVALLPAVGHAQTVEWVQSAGGIFEDRGRGIAVDADGNSYVTGVFHGTATFGSLTLTSAGSADIFVAKYDAGAEVLWAKSAGGTSGDEAFGIAVDATGNSCVTGAFSGTATFGPFTLTSAFASDVFVAKFDNAGNVLWARSGGGASNAGGRGMAVDAAGNSYVTGYFGGRATFGSLTLTSAGGSDIFVAKYDASGSALWARSAGGTSGDHGRGIAVDATGNNYVTGNYAGTATFGPFTLTSTGPFDVFVAKYDGSGDVLWARSAGGTSGDQAFGIAVDATGNSHVTGSFYGTATFGSFTLISVGSGDIFVAKYDSSGNVLWARSAGGTSGEQVSGIAVNDTGNSYVTGDYSGTATFGAFSIISAGSVDIFVAKYDSSGDVLWARSAGGTSGDQAFGIAVDYADNTYATGDYFGTATFGPFTLTSVGSVDIFLAKYAPPVCGDGVVESGEECDGGVGCTDCLCNVDFEPTAPPSLDCQGICGNGSIDPGEECDGGLGCTDCLCDTEFEPTAPPSLDCQPTCGNGSVDPGEECDGGLGCTDCLCDADFEPTAPPSLDCQPLCGNGSIDPGEECDGMDDTGCPGACLSNCTCDLLCGNGACDPSEDSCNCPDDCGTPPLREVLGSTCDDGNDNDCDGLTDSADPDCGAIPTVSAWGLMVIALALLTVEKIVYTKHKTPAA